MVFETPEKVMLVLGKPYSSLRRCHIIANAGLGLPIHENAFAGGDAQQVIEDRRG